VNDGELRRAYRTLNEPARLLGISVAGWLAVLAAGALGYAWLLVSPLGWRANVSLAVIVLGAPVALLLLREQATISPGQLLIAVVRWRARPARITAVDDRSVRSGGVRLDAPAPAPAAPSVEERLGQVWLGERS
jgi:hypothetical protein